MTIMRRLTWVLPIVVLGALVAVAYFVLFSDTELYRKYQRIQPGMSVAEVEEMFGPGEIVARDRVPMINVPVNPEDARAAYERARREGQSPVTATSRDYPTKSVPVVDGDVIRVWESRETLEWIYVAFKDGLVCGTHYRTLNYL
ncbi:MAG TPA: hypothetical protein VM597_25165 [Gemmataceae bacterium]|nr:hypothetical protein [Gemmataceae bacterium]